jgi:hypothetical protein
MGTNILEKPPSIFRVEDGDRRFFQIVTTENTISILTPLGTADLKYSM